MLERFPGRGGNRRRLAREGPTSMVLLALALGVLVPAAAIIWFMTEAAGNQADAARQRLADALNGQLRLLRDRIDADWRARVARLSALPGRGALAFERAVGSGALDSIVFLPADPDEYPDASSPRTPAAEAGVEWRLASALEASGNFAVAASRYARLAAGERHPDRAARAAQGHVRALVLARDATAARDAIEHYFAGPRLLASRDRHGRLIAADAQLLGVRLTAPADAGFDPAVARLSRTLNDYEGISMPASQRLFLMEELRTLAGPSLTLPTYEAERLAAAFVDTDGVRPAGEGLEPSRVRDVWKLALGSDAVALFRTDSLVEMAGGVLSGQSVAAGATFALVPPGHDAGAAAVAASPLLPGWLVRVSLDDATQVERAARGRMSAYLWAGTIAVAGLAVAGSLLWQAFRRQQRLSRLKTDLVAAVSHELRTPLASMRALVDLLLESPSIDRERAREYLTLIAGENARLSRLIEHFLAFSRVERDGGTSLVFRDVSAPALVAAAAAVHGRERSPHLTVDVEPDLPPLYGDEDALLTVLLNLLENAYKYTGDEKRIVLRARLAAAMVVFEVEDNGVGIARADRGRIFQPFYQVDQRLARERGGCGLGLSIVAFVVRAHGGRVSVQSEPGSGSVFRVALPSRLAGRETAA